MTGEFILKATYDGYSGPDLWLSFSWDNYVILNDSYAVHMFQSPDDLCLYAPRDQFPLAVNSKVLAQYWDERASWRDYAFNMKGDAVVFIDRQIALNLKQEKRLCVHGDDRRVYWSKSTSDPKTNYLVFTQIPYK